MTRPTADVARRLLAANGTAVTLIEPQLTEDVDGWPLAVHVETTAAVLLVTPELLGWTRAELGLPEQDEQ